MNIQAADLLEHTSCRVHLLRDLVSAVQSDSLLLTDSGLAGLSMALGDISSAIETAREMVASRPKINAQPAGAPASGKRGIRVVK